MKPVYILLSVLAAVACLCMTAPACAGPDWEETCDAGSVPATAQAVTVVGQVKSIRGQLAPCPALGVGVPDFEDMYLIRIQQPAIFCARTISGTEDTDCCGGSIDPHHGTNFNTQLWLFRADGIGRLGNDNQSPFIPPGLSGFQNASNDGTGIVITTPGLYYIAVSGGPNRDPVSQAGLIFNQLATFEISGPDGPGGTLPINGWIGPGVQGQYEIIMCGVQGVPSIPTVSEWSMIAMAAAVVIAGAFLIARERKAGMSAKAA